VSQFRRGDVIRRHRYVGVVREARIDRVLVWPVLYRPSERAGDVVPDTMADHAALDGRRDVVIFAASLLDVPAAGQVRLGTISPALLARVVAASDRATTTRAVIGRWQRDYGHRADECQPASRAL
jgi:hypothetical protein